MHNDSKVMVPDLRKDGMLMFKQERPYQVEYCWKMWALAVSAFVLFSFKQTIKPKLKCYNIKHGCYNIKHG